MAITCECKNCERWEYVWRIIDHHGLRGSVPCPCGHRVIVPLEESHLPKFQLTEAFEELSPAMRRDVVRLGALDAYVEEWIGPKITEDTPLWRFIGGRQHGCNEDQRRDDREEKSKEDAVA